TPVFQHNLFYGARAGSRRICTRKLCWWGLHRRHPRPDRGHGRILVSLLQRSERTTTVGTAVFLCDQKYLAGHWGNSSCRGRNGVCFFPVLLALAPRHFTPVIVYGRELPLL